MMVIYEEALPESYLLILGPGTGCPSKTLASLRRACLSRKPAVWVDCRLLEAASHAEAMLLATFGDTVREHDAQLVLCQVSERLAQLLRQGGAAPCIVPTLQDAAYAPHRRGQALPG